MFVVGAEHKDKVLIKSNSVNLSNGCNQLPQCALSSPANGCSAICYVDRYTHTSQEKWISGNKDPLFSPPLTPSLPPSPCDVNGPYIPLDHVSLEQACRTVTVHRLTKHHHIITGRCLYTSDISLQSATVML